MEERTTHDWLGEIHGIASLATSGASFGANVRYDGLLLAVLSSQFKSNLSILSIYSIHFLFFLYKSCVETIRLLMFVH